MEQHLLMRGSRDFESLAVYESFLFSIMEKRNARRQQRLAEEMAVMKPLTVAPWPQMREFNVRVGTNGILRVGANGYTVPSGLHRLRHGAPALGARSAALSGGGGMSAG